MIDRRGIVLLHTELGDYWTDRLIHSGLNVLGIHPAGGEAASQSLADTIRMAGEAAYRALYHRLRESGIDVEYEAHALAWMFPRSLYASHPRLFRMNAAGDRVADCNFCFTNPDAIAFVEEKAEHLAKVLVPTTNRYYFWSDDVGGDCFCHCGDCRKYTPSEQYMLFANAALRGIRRVNPNATHAYLAYVRTLPAPRKVDPEDGIFLEYAPIGRDQFIPIDSRQCEKNVAEAKHIGDLISCFGTKNSQVLEYWVDNSRFSNWRRPYRKLLFDSYIMKRDVRYYLDCGFESITGFGCWLDNEYFEMYGEPPIREYARVLNGYGEDNA